MKRMLAMAVLVTATLGVASARADSLTLAADDTVQTVLTGQQGKRVTLKLGSGDELSGTVKKVTGRLVHLGELTGKELFDAAVAIEEVAAVIVRAKE